MRSHLLLVGMLAVVLGTFGGQKKKTISPEKATKLLFQAITAEDPELVLLAIHNKADVNAKVGDDWTPLRYTCENGNFKIAKILIQEGAKVYANANSDCLDLALHSRNLQLADLVIAHGIPISEKNRRQYESILVNGTINPQLEFLGLFYRDPTTFRQQLTKKNDTELNKLEKLAQWYGCSEPLVLIQAPNKFKNRLHNLLRTHKQVDIEAI
jgi:hypothetical protein